MPRLLKVTGLLADITKINDAARGKWFSNFMLALAVLRNYKPFGAPPSMALLDLVKKFDECLAMRGEEKTKKRYGASGPERTREDTEKRRSDPWNILMVAGMWFQDLFNYDFRRTEMCIIPYATQQGEISFCAYNTGIGWRKIIEHIHKTATVSEWYKTHGKHEIYARGKSVELESADHSLKVNAEDVARVRDRSSDVPMTASEEERLRRRAAWEERQARQIYEELVLKKPANGNGQLIQIGKAKAAAENVPA
jgi:hypothetical protein